MFHPFIDFNDYDYQVHIHGMLWPRSIGTIAALRGFFCLLRLKLENAEQPVAYVCSQILMTPSGWFNYRATIGYWKWSKCAILLMEINLWMCSIASGGCVCGCVCVCVCVGGWMCSVASRRGQGGRVPLDTGKFCKFWGEKEKRGEKSGKMKIERKGNKRESSFTLPLLTDRAGYVTGEKQYMCCNLGKSATYS